MAKKKEIKFTKEELSSLESLKDSYSNVELSLGKLEVARLQTEQRLEQIENEKLRLETEYTQIQIQENELVSELNEKYGPGNLDPNTGVFTPAK
tara:strand:- start:181 stop:462 length:282 start_codon:yes stop_codon:yes gene_type:complete